MLKCRDIARHASDYLDATGDLPRWQVRLHLAMCGHCRRLVRHLRLASRTGARLEANDRPARSDCEAVLARIKEREAQSRSEP